MKTNIIQILIIVVLLILIYYLVGDIVMPKSQSQSQLQTNVGNESDDETIDGQMTERADQMIGEALDGMFD